MKSYQQLAQSAYQAHAKETQRGGAPAPRAWEELTAAEKASWEAVAKQLWAEFAALP